MNGGSVLEVKNVSNTYISRSFGLFGRAKGLEVLKNVSLNVANGEIFGLVGESGCGKTTLGRAILGLIDYSGEITVNGVKQTGKNRREMARLVQSVFQDPAGALNPVKRVGWLLEEPLRASGMRDARERARLADESLELVGLDASYRGRRPSELSGGQKQRVCIACALMLKPKLLIADEAVSALDVSVGAQILNLLRDLHTRMGLSTVFISHNPGVIYYLCDRIAVMRGGGIIEQGTAREICENPKTEYTRLLFGGVV
ncbi:MAG: ATP-binding cassette domain-containing protein [Oscillospiraceae bacterium]|jgi:ABC-type glutathione transport system ATPase component|nr:ATP-binding cassette domain-containing protein [Oscillospiraceae bacterium]